MQKSKPKTAVDDLLSGNPLAANFPNMMVSTARMQGQMVNTCIRYNIEIFGFLKQRLEEDLKLVNKITATDDADDAVNSFMSFWREAMIEYSDEAGKLATINSKFATDAVKQIQDQAKVVNDDFISTPAN